MLTILELVLKGGFRTSEFWVTVLGLAVTATAPFVQGWVNSLHAQQTASTSPAGAIALGVAAAIISGTYTVARMLVKGRTADAAAVIESAPGPDQTVSAPPPTAQVILTPAGNLMTPGAGSASLEEAHRQAILAATDALRVAQSALQKASNLAHPSTFGGAGSPVVTAPAAPLSPTSAVPAPVESSSSSSGSPPGST